MPSLQNEHTQFIDELSSTPVVNGYIYIGAQNQDPGVSYLTTVIYSDRALTVPLANPQRTDSTGRSVNKIYVEAEYSIKVTDSGGVVKLNDWDSGPAADIVTSYLTVDKGVNYTTVEGNAEQTINATAAVTISLGDAGTMGAGYVVTVKNSHTSAITVDLDTAADTLDGTVAGSQTIPVDGAASFATNADIDGYLYVNNAGSTQVKGADIASASALPTPSTNFADVTGTTSVTSIVTSNVVGSRILRQFDASLTLTHHATDLILPGGQNLQTLPGDIAEFVEYATGDWMLSNYYRAGWNTDGAYDSRIEGLLTAPDVGATPATDILINTGSCADSSRTVRMRLDTILTKVIDSDWVAGDDLGGLAVGSRSVTDVPNASTWYHYFIISDGTTVDAGWDTATNASNLLTDSGYTYYRRIASHYVNVSNTIDAYTQVGDYFGWHVPVTNKNGAAASNETAITLSVPLGIETEAEIVAIFSGTTLAGYVRIYPTSHPDAAVALVNATLSVVNNSPNDNQARFFIQADTSSQINHRASVSNNLAVNTAGWKDSRSI